MLQILSLLFGTIARRKTCLWIQGPDKNLEQKCPSRVIHNRCGSCASPLLSNPQEISTYSVPSMCTYTAKICFQSDTYFNTDSVTVRCYLSTNRKNQDLKQGKGNKHLATQHFGPNSTCTAPTEIQIWATFVSRLSTECVSIVIEMKKGMSFWTLFHWSDLPAQPMSSDQK